MAQSSYLQYFAGAPARAFEVVLTRTLRNPTRPKSDCSLMDPDELSELAGSPRRWGVRERCGYRDIKSHLVAIVP
jgi:hypothetical protein